MREARVGVCWHELAYLDADQEFLYNQKHLLDLNSQQNREIHWHR
jgi:hypothetical protein